MGSFPLTVTVTTRGYRSYKNPLNKAPLRTVTGRGNDPTPIFILYHLYRVGSPPGLYIWSPGDVFIARQETAF